MGMNICCTNGILNTGIIMEPEVKGKVTGESTGSTISFKSILESSMNSAPGKTDAAKGTSSNDSIAKGNKVPSCVRNNIRDTRVKTARDTKTAVKTEPDREAGLNEAENTGRRAGEDTIYDAVAEVLAELLGIEPFEAKKLMESLGITPEDFSDTSGLPNAFGLQEVTKKLGNFLKLDSSQKDTLLRIIQETVSETEKALNSDLPQRGENPSKDGWVELRNAVVKIADRIKEEIKIPEETRAAVLEFSLRLQETAGEEAGSASADNARDISEAAAAVRQDVDFTDMAKPEGNELFVQKDGMSGKKLLEEGMDREASEDTEMDFSTDRRLSRKDETGLNSSENIMNAGEDQPARFNAVFNDIRAASAAPDKVSGPESEVFAPREAIVNQVVEKAQVLLTGDKSEMVIHLKPDHLGKLTLKIVTENGMVTARIVAENKQVKHVLESNMLLLKESLEKQGMVVQDFSVSVSQDSSQQQLRQNFHQERTVRTQSGTAAISGMESASVSHNPFTGINPYDIYQSSINLTA